MYQSVVCDLPFRENMDHICQHCDELMVGNAYRVTSEDQGIPLFDTVVCSLRFMGGKAASPSRRGSQCRKQTAFSSKPGESPSSAWHLIKAPSSPVSLG